ncbi:uncharacterized protein LOC117641681 [Thrips palmi]|uniref:Uncharacterized protein LOC117641681 n=1 Tax=Thrips palmi TaxID=161013 RepID=A0A6P8ZJB9_THRPL|nr:uncharacterized protein LOC117641681 [Thrips palmi]
MSPDQAALIRSFRQELEGASFGLGQVNDNELEGWLFQAGADRVHLLQWCLSQLDPVLRDRFQNCEEKEAEKRTIEHLKSYGISSRADIILGSAALKEQVVLWKKLLELLKGAKSLKQSPSKGRNTRASVTLQTCSSLSNSKDFFALLHTKQKLIPTDLRCVTSTVCKRDYEKELTDSLARLEELKNLASNLSSDDEKSFADRPVQTSEDYEENFLSSFKKIKECHKIIMDTVFPAVKPQPENPIVNILGSYIEVLADNLSAFVQMLKSTEDIHQMAEALQKSRLEGLEFTDSSPLQECISKSYMLVTETLSLWRIHNLT